MASGTSLFQAVRSIMAKVFIRQRLGELMMLQGDWRNEVCTQETTLTAQSQMIRKWSLVLSFPRILSPAQRLMAKVTTVIDMFATRKTFPLVALT